MTLLYLIILHRLAIFQLRRRAQGELAAADGTRVQVGANFKGSPEVDCATVLGVNHATGRVLYSFALLNRGVNAKQEYEVRSAQVDEFVAAYHPTADKKLPTETLGFYNPDSVIDSARMALGKLVDFFR
jgi:hypothetical protein